MYTNKEKVAHLLRRFGLGATYEEVESYSRLDFDNALIRLLHYEGVDEDYNVSPWSFAFTDNPKQKVALDNPRFYSWWATQMLFTKRPLQQNLTLFWHNHFAVSGSKIEYGANMLDYLLVLQENANGNFRQLLSKISRTPAMIQWLDSDSNIKGRPNENFGREVMELFTLGIGHYTETDVKEAARAFTGWSTKYAVSFPPKTPYDVQVRENVEAGRPMYCFCDCPELHDDGFKTILGKRKEFDAEQVFDLLVSQPSHAPFLMKKMWEWFVYPNPSPESLEKVCKVYIDSKYEIKPVLHYLATCDEFWSDQAMRAVVKSPVSYTISIARQANYGSGAAAKANFNTSPTEVVAPQLMGIGFTLANLMQRQGLRLLFPPDVSGWRWGTRWITTATMMERMKIGDSLLGGGNAVALWKDLHETFKPQKPEDVVDALATWFDAPLDKGSRAVLVETVDKAGGMKAMAKPGTAAQVLRAAFKVMSSTPEFQMS